MNGGQKGSPNIWIGIEQVNPKYEWWMRLKDCKKFQSDENKWIDYGNKAV